MNDTYIEVISLTERLHRRFLEVVKLELEGLHIHDINNVQALILFNIGEAEMTVGELTLRGCYLGSNVTYNVKKLRDSLMAMHQRHTTLLPHAVLSADDLRATEVTLRNLERFWSRKGGLMERPQRAA